MKIKMLRFLQDKSQYVLANESGVHQGRISLIERGIVKPTLKERENLAKALNVKPEQLDFEVSK
jgi:transcriptional regulator with XRE-family HTH domain